MHTKEAPAVSGPFASTAAIRLAPARLIRRMNRTTHLDKVRINIAEVRFQVTKRARYVKQVLQLGKSVSTVASMNTQRGSLAFDPWVWKASKHGASDIDRKGRK